MSHKLTHASSSLKIFFTAIIILTTLLMFPHASNSSRNNLYEEEQQPKLPNIEVKQQNHAFLSERGQGSRSMHHHHNDKTRDHDGSIMVHNKTLSKTWRNCNIEGEGSEDFFYYLLHTNPYEVLRNPKYPLIGCESISVPNMAYSVVEEHWKLDAFPNAKFYSRHVVENLCETFNVSLVPSCKQVLCNDKGSVMTNVQLELIEDRLFDFLNYCQYCSQANGFHEYHQLLENQTCRNGNSSIQQMISSFPNYIRYCGSINIGIPVITPLAMSVTGSQQLPYIYTCYCFQSNEFELFCEKKGAIHIMQEFKRIGITMMSSILAIMSLFFLIIPKLIIWRIKAPNHNYTFLQIIPSIFVLLSLCCRIISLHVPQFMYPMRLETMFSSVAEFLNYFSLVPILIYWFGVMRYLQTLKRASSWKKYLLCLFVLVFCIGLSIELGFLEAQIPRNLTNVVWILSSWIVEMIIFAIFSGFSLFIYLALKRISEINSVQTSFGRFSLFCVGVMMVFTNVDLCLLVSALWNEREMYSFFSAFVLVVYLVLATGIIVFEFSKVDFVTLYRYINHSKTNQTDNRSWVSTSSSAVINTEYEQIER